MNSPHSPPTVAGVSAGTSAAPKTSPHADDSEMKVTIPRATAVYTNQKGGKYRIVVYIVAIRQGGARWKVERRYSDFAAFRALLSQNVDPHAALPSLPGNRFLGLTNSSPRRIEQRRADLEVFLKQIIARGLDKHPVVANFLSQESHKPDSTDQNAETFVIASIPEAEVQTNGNITFHIQCESGPRAWRVSKSYADFVEHFANIQLMKREEVKALFPIVPGAIQMVRHNSLSDDAPPVSDADTAKRRLDLERFLQRALTPDQGSQDPDVLAFLDEGDFEDGLDDGQLEVPVELMQAGMQLTPAEDLESDDDEGMEEEISSLKRFMDREMGAPATTDEDEDEEEDDEDEEDGPVNDDEQDDGSGSVDPATGEMLNADGSNNDGSGSSSGNQQPRGRPKRRGAARHTQPIGSPPPHAMHHILPPGGGRIGSPPPRPMVHIRVPGQPTQDNSPPNVVAGTLGAEDSSHLSVTSAMAEAPVLTTRRERKPKTKRFGAGSPPGSATDLSDRLGSSSPSPASSPVVDAPAYVVVDQGQFPDPSPSQPQQDLTRATIPSESITSPTTPPSPPAMASISPATTVSDIAAGSIISQIASPGTPPATPISPPTSPPPIPSSPSPPSSTQSTLTAATLRAAAFAGSLRGRSGSTNTESSVGMMSDTASVVSSTYSVGSTGQAPVVATIPSVEIISPTTVTPTSSGSPEFSSGDVVYIVNCRMANHAWTVRKRYSDFEDFARGFKPSLSASAPALPGHGGLNMLRGVLGAGTVVAPSDPVAVETRRKELEDWLMTLLKPVGGQQDQELLLFLRRGMEVRHKMPSDIGVGRSKIHAPVGTQFVSQRRHQEVLQFPSALPTIVTIPEVAVNYFLEGTTIVYVMVCYRGDSRWRLHKRYTDFAHLHRMFMESMPNEELPPLPSKALFGATNKSKRLIERRRVALERMLQSLVHLARGREIEPAFLLFLQPRKDHYKQWTELLLEPAKKLKSGEKAASNSRHLIPNAPGPDADNAPFSYCQCTDEKFCCQYGITNVYLAKCGIQIAIKPPPDRNGEVEEDGAR